MTGAGIELRTAVLWTADELAESYTELADVEALRRSREDVAERGGDDLEIIATVEGREPEEPARAPREAAGVPRVDAETYAVMPELEQLLTMLDTFAAEAPREDADDAPQRQ